MSRSNIAAFRRADSSFPPLAGGAGPAVADGDLKDKLKTIEGELAEARDERAIAQRESDAAKAAFAKSPNLKTTSREFKAAEQARRSLGEVDDRIADLQAAQTATLRMLGKESPASRHGGGSDGRGWDSRSAIEAIGDGLQRMASTKHPFRELDLGIVADKDDVAASLGTMVDSFGGVPMATDVTGTTAMRRGDYGGIVPQLRRRLRILDLIPTGTMDANTFPYTQEGGSFATAAETAEGSLKPEAAITVTDAEASAATIAHWSKIRKQTLADAPALQSIIDQRLRYGVERRLEGQVLAGDGSGSNLTGILNTSGLGNVAFDNTQLPADQVLTGITTVLLADAEADAVVMNPLDWAAALKAKAAGDGHYYSDGPFSVTPQQLWGVPLIPSAAVAQGTVLVGDWAIGAMLLIREGVNVLLSDSDQDDFIRNRVTMLGEMRAALPVFRPAAFCTVHLS